VVRRTTRGVVERSGHRPDRLLFNSLLGRSEPWAPAPMPAYLPRTYSSNRNCPPNLRPGGIRGHKSLLQKCHTCFFLSFLRKQESSEVKGFWTPASAGVTAFL